MSEDATATLFLCGDVMLGRGIDQILTHSCQPQLYESVMHSAQGYVALAERVNGPIPRRVEPTYVWGDALELLAQMQPDARIVNLETSITTSEDAEPKGINYRMHPGNIDVLTAAGVDCCVLSNNHVRDWGEAGLLETLATLESAGIRSAGAGVDLRSAQAPTRLELPTGAALWVFGMCANDCGVPPAWAGGVARPSVNLLPDLGDETVEKLAATVAASKRAGDLAIASIHWGGNWGYSIPDEHRRFAHALIDHAGIDFVHGHSSHHPKPIELHHDHAILYGCGDFLNDYEGIGGHESYRPELALMYFVTLELTSGRVRGLELHPLRIRKFRLSRATASDRAWLRAAIDRESRPLGVRVVEHGRALTIR